MVVGGGLLLMIWLISEIGFRWIIVLCLNLFELVVRNICCVLLMIVWDMCIFW